MPEISIALRKERDKRMLIFSILMFIMTSILASLYLFWLYVYGVSFWVSIPYVTAFLLLTLYASVSLITQFVGLYIALTPVEKDRFNPINNAVELKEDTRVAVLMPIYHENVRRVFGGLSAMITDLLPYKESKHFVWFILSDSRREDIIAQEQKAVFILKEQFPDVEIHYRHRIVNTFAKVGNTTDFFRRWGNYCKFVVMLDADASIPGETMSTLARTIEGDENIGFIQVSLSDIPSTTLYGRYRCSTRIAAPVYVASDYYFKLARGSFFGHNAILRTEAITKCCALPILKKSGPFMHGKPTSHDVFEYLLMEGAGYTSWILPSLVSYDDELQNHIDAMKREHRWFVGNMNWLRLWRYKNLSSFGKFHLLLVAFTYCIVIPGLLLVLLSYYGIYYALRHAMLVQAMLHHFKNIAEFSTVYFLSAMLSPFFVTIFYVHKSYGLKRVGGLFKLLFSFLFRFILGTFLSFVDMFFILYFLYNWVRGYEMIWEAQNREKTLCSWTEIFQCKPIIMAMVFGLGLLYFFLNYISPLATEENLQTLGLGKSFYFWFTIPIISCLCAPLTVRLTSYSFPWMQRMGWLMHQYEREEDQAFVVKNMRKMTKWFGTQVAEDWSFEQALSDPYFALRHLAQCPSRPQKYAFWKDKLAGRNIQDLTRLEKLVVFRCRELWEMFMTKNFHVSKEKTQ